MRLSLLFRMQKQQPLPDLTGAVAAPLSEEAEAMMKLVAALPSSAPAHISPHFQQSTVFWAARYI
jgi:hypothetical protein